MSDSEQSDALNGLKNCFSEYYRHDYDIFGNNVTNLSLSLFAVKSYYNNFFKTTRIMERLVINGFTELGKYKFLDAGCGGGQDLRSMVELGALPENCHGIDFSGEATAFARKVSPPAMTFSNSPLHQTGLPDASCDVIFCFNTICNYHDDGEVAAIVAELRRVIKPQGILLLIGTIGDSSKGFGLANLPVRVFSVDEMTRLFNSFRLTDLSTCSVNGAEFDSNIVLQDSSGRQADVGALFALLDDLRKQKQYSQFFLEGALQHMLAGLGLAKCTLKLLTFRPA